MRFVFAATGWLGHINFSIPLALRLRDEGQQVTYVIEPTVQTFKALHRHNLAAIPFATAELQGSTIAPGLAFDDVRDWTAFTANYRLATETHWPLFAHYVHPRLNTQLVGHADPVLTRVHRAAILNVLNRAIFDPQLLSRPETRFLVDKAMEYAGEALSEPEKEILNQLTCTRSLQRKRPAQLRELNRTLLIARFFAEQIPLRHSSLGSEKPTWPFGALRRLAEKRRFFESAVDGFFAETASIMPDLILLLKPDVLLFELFASELVGLHLSRFREAGVKVAQLDYSFPNEPSWWFPPLDSAAVPGTSVARRARVGWAWAWTILRERLRGLLHLALTLGISWQRVREKIARLNGYRSANQFWRLTWWGVIPRHVTRIVLAPRALDFGCAKLPRVHFLQAPIRERQGETEPGPLPFAVRELLIYCTLGTVNPVLRPAASERVFKRVISLCEQLGDCTLLLTAWNDRLTEQLQKSAKVNLVVKKFFPHHEVLPHCTLAIHHGGINTILDCVNHTVPMLIFPQYKTDQPGNAARVEHHRIGCVARSWHTDRQLLRRLQLLLKDASYRERLVALRERILQAQTWSCAEEIQTAVK